MPRRKQNTGAVLIDTMRLNGNRSSSSARMSDQSSPRMIQLCRGLLLALLLCSSVSQAFSPALSQRAARSVATSRSTQAFGTTTTTTSSHTALLAAASSFVELTDPETGCNVVLLGCFHGSNSSAADVVEAVDSHTNVVVMELCAGRFADLRRDYLVQQERQAQNSNNATGGDSDTDGAAAPSQSVPLPPRRPWVVRFAEMVTKTAASKGIGAGIATAVLAGVSGGQAALSGLIPGLEFTTALERSIEVGADVVLADQVVDETLQKIGQLPVTAVDMWRELLVSRDISVFQREAIALAQAVAGNPNDKNMVALPAFLTRSPAATADMVRSILPPFLVMQTFVFTANAAAETLLADSMPATFNAAAATVETAPAATLGVLAANVAILAFAYLSVALPATRVVLRERDDTLYQGIRQACRLAVQKANAVGNNKPGKVVAVLGLLHVNGVAARIQASENDRSDMLEQQGTAMSLPATNVTQFAPVEL